MMGLKFQVWTYLPCEACTITVIIKINMIVILKLIIIILMIESFGLSHLLKWFSIGHTLGTVNVKIKLDKIQKKPYKMG